LNRHSAVQFHAGAGGRFLSAGDARLGTFVKRGFGGKRIHEDDSSGLGAHLGLSDARCAACHDDLAESRLKLASERQSEQIILVPHQQPGQTRPKEGPNDVALPIASILAEQMTSNRQHSQHFVPEKL
jgi:hypothetical protein